MKRQYPVLFLVLFLAIFTVGTGCNLWAGNAYVKYVIDGDTIVLSNGEKVRYLGINAPEIPHDDQKGEPYGIAAKKRNRALVQGRVVRLEYGPRKRDRFGRLLAYVFLKDGTLVNEVLVREGLAFVCLFQKDIPYKDRLLSAQRHAIINKIGLWSLSPRRPEPYYIGNRKSLRFHRPWCPYGRRTWRENRVIFKTREQAFLKGYCRCKKCLP